MKIIEDSEIIGLYWAREQSAISATDQKYGRFCMSIASNILSDDRDAEECVNDTWLSAWNAMPPHKPSVLSAFLAKLTRNISFNRYKQNRAQKRGGGCIESALDELADCVSGADNVEHELDERLLVEAINEFLSSLPTDRRVIFIRRYWYTDSVGDIARRMCMKEGNVSMTLTRTRRNLKKYLRERGFDL